MDGIATKTLQPALQASERDFQKSPECMNNISPEMHCMKINNALIEPMYKMDSVFT